MNFPGQSAAENALLKREIRRRHRAQRGALSAEFRAESSRRITHHLIGWFETHFRTPRAAVALYLATEVEANIDQFAYWLLAREIPVAVPIHSQRVEEREGRTLLSPLRPASTLNAPASTFDVCLNARGVREPSISRQHVAPQEIGCWILPGLAFDVQGTRLGYGGGWFDRVLAQRAPQSAIVGVGFESQIENYLPRDAHDVAVQFIITEARVLEI